MTEVYDKPARMGKVTVGPSMPLTDRIPIGANDAIYRHHHNNPKHNLENEISLSTVLTSSQDVYSLQLEKIVMSIDQHRLLGVLSAAVII